MDHGAVMSDPRTTSEGQVELDAREHRLFFALDAAGEGRVARFVLEQTLAQVGLDRADPRLRESLRALEAFPPSARLTYPEFCSVIRPSILLWEQAIQGKLVIPDFQAFCDEVRQIYADVAVNRAGSIATYIPQLARVDPEQFAVALCSIDGQRLVLGDADVDFCVQSCCKPINYCLALEQHGQETVHRHVGREPSGRGFNELTLNHEGRPHNPMINAGAIMAVSLIEPTLPLSDRFEHVMDCWHDLAGDTKARFSNTTYLSERQTADRNYALGYYMRENKAFPAGTDLQETLEFYFQCCSIELNARHMATVAATLAQGGVCPVTSRRVFSGHTVQNCLSLMYSCGMYDFSGEFAFSIGLPAKSGVSGAMMLVVPNLCGICVWSPRLDSLGNSVRGVEFCKRLVARFNIHNYDNLTRLTEKRDPRVSRLSAKAERVNEVLWAAGKGDRGAIERLVVEGAALQVADYDQRTALHIAAAEGRERTVTYLVDQGVELDAEDHRGCTPLDDALAHGHAAVAEALEQRGARRGSGSVSEERPALGAAPPEVSGSESPDVVQLIWAASEGDLDVVTRLVARGVDLDGVDYDARTALHLAAARGNEEIVRYLLAHGARADLRDRWGVTPQAEAERQGCAPISELLRGEPRAAGRRTRLYEDALGADAPAAELRG